MSIDASTPRLTEAGRWGANKATSLMTEFRQFALIQKTIRQAARAKRVDNTRTHSADGGDVRRFAGPAPVRLLARSKCSTHSEKATTTSNLATADRIYCQQYER